MNKRSILFLTFSVFQCFCQVNFAQTQTSLGSINSVAVQADLKTVKLYGAGGIAGLDTYQSGFFIDEAGHILTVWSTVLDIDKVIAVTSDGRRLEATVLGIDPNLEIAILETKQSQLEYFDLAKARDAEVGERVLALSNLFGIATGREMASVQKGVVMARTRLDARRGTFASVYQGPIYVIDAMTNNPGAAAARLSISKGDCWACWAKSCAMLAPTCGLITHCRSVS